MKKNLNDFRIIRIILVFIGVTSINCIENENDKLIEQVFGKNDSYWFKKAEDVDAAVCNISQSRRIFSKLDKDVFFNTSQLITEHGYEAQEHSLTTEDGYNLILFQIVGEGPTVFLMHGLFGSSDDFVVSGQEKTEEGKESKALAFILADLGYDVWLGNARGNVYSRSHVLLNPKFGPFWEFSFHEIGVIDLPTMVDHALMVSRHKQLTYIGHGLGTTVFFVLNSYRPEYNKKFNLMISLATIAWNWHSKSPVLKAQALLPDSHYALLENLGYYELFPRSPAAQFLKTRVCCSSNLALLTCFTALFNIVGFDYSQINYNTACVILAHFPSGSSIRQLRHYLQLYRSKEFAQFDFGREENLATYGTPTPPSYDVESITAPIAIFYGKNDWISSLDDTGILEHRLQNVLEVIRVPHSKFNYFDFIYAKDADLLLYHKIILLIEENVSRAGFEIIETVNETET